MQAPIRDPRQLAGLVNELAQKDDPLQEERHSVSFLLLRESYFGMAEWVRTYGGEMTERQAAWTPLGHYRAIR